MEIDIRHIAKLARLRIASEKEEKFKNDMKNIVDMVDRLPDIDCNISLLDPDNPMQLREDIAVPDKFTRDQLLANAPQVQAGCFAVPKTVE